MSLEQPHPRADEVGWLGTLPLLELMNSEDVTTAAAVGKALPALADAVDLVAARLAGGGRLHYYGAGTSGRLAIVDAAECPPTFGTPPELVTAHVAADGEGAEDDFQQGRVDALELGSGDVAVAVSASGETPYALGAAEQARATGALLVAVVCAAGSSLAALADVAVVAETGPEVVAGSTRLKAGTAQKMMLNMLSTAVFTKLGRVHRGRMVGVLLQNRKLRGRAIRIIQDLIGASAAQAEEALETGGDVPTALVMLALDLPADEARRRLENAGGKVGEVLP